MPTVIPTGHEAELLTNIAGAISRSVAWQTWCGVEAGLDPPAESLAFVWVDKREDDDLDSDPAIILRAQVAGSARIASPDAYERSGTVWVVFKGTIPNQYRDFPGDAAFWWSNQVDAVLDDLRADGAVSIVTLNRDDGVQESNPVERGDADDPDAGWYRRAEYVLEYESA